MEIFSFLFAGIALGFVLSLFLIPNRTLKNLFTRNELVEAQQNYNRQYIEDPENFIEEIQPTREYAENQIDYIIGMIRRKK